MGAGMAQAALERGENLRVWNRTRTKAEPLGQLGAQVAETPAEAVQGADFVHLILHADDAVDEVLTQILPHLAKNAVLIDHSTTLPARTLTRAQELAQAGVAFLHVPVFMSPQNCRTATGLMVAAGPQTVFQQAEAELRKMTGNVWYVGERADLAACHKLFGNAMLLGIAGVMADIFTMARQNHITPLDAHALFTHLDPTGAVKVRGLKMAKEDFTPSFQLDTARKDLELMLQMAQPAVLAMLPGLAARMDQGLQKGWAAEDFGVISRAELDRP